MSNIINSQNYNINNIYTQSAVSMGKKSPAFVEAPNHLPKYSIDDVLNERDEFRHQIFENQRETLKKKQSKLPKIAFLLTVFTGTLLLSLKKGK